MAKGKTVNPADAFRKAQRKKELKKNKSERQKTRDFALVKKDTNELEDEITKLEAVVQPSAEEKARLKQLKNELADIKKKKEEYVEAHPEQRKLVYASARRREQRDREDAGGSAPTPEPRKRNIFKKNGLPRHPERSIYYDPVMNPFGMAPPGMPYVERALLPGEIDSDAEAEQKGDDDGDDDNDDIAMPEGPPPGHSVEDTKESEDEDEDEDEDDIPLPEGPPPDRATKSNFVPQTQPPLPPGPPPVIPAHLPPLPPQPLYNQPILPPNPMAPFPPSFLPHPPIFHGAHKLPYPPPPPFPNTTLTHNIPLPPPPFSHTVFAGNVLLPPPGFLPRRAQAPQALLQDPLSPIVQTQLPYQAHRAAMSGVPPPPPPLPPPPSSLPHNPNLPPRPQVAAPGAPLSHPPTISASAVVSAEPELRDLKKESTAFVPSSLKRKKGPAQSARVNAAPALDGGKDSEVDADTSSPQRPDLIGILREKFGPMPAVSVDNVEEGTSAKKRKLPPPSKKPGADDYEKFLSEMKDML